MLFTTPPKDPIYQPVISIVQKKEGPAKPLPYVVQPGDSLTTIADLHSSSVARLWAANTQITNPDHIEPGTSLNVPLNTDVLADRPLPAIVEVSAEGAVLPSSPSTQVGYSYSGNTGPNLFTPGNCTFFVASQRPIPNSFGDAYNWLYAAQAAGWATGSEPRVGAVAWAKGYGHVAIVRSIGNGTVHVQEENYQGLYIISERDAPISEFLYIY